MKMKRERTVKDEAASETKTCVRLTFPPVALPGRRLQRLLGVLRSVQRELRRPASSDLSAESQRVERSDACWDFCVLLSVTASSDVVANIKLA